MGSITSTTYITITTIFIIKIYSENIKDLQFTKEIKTKYDFSNRKLNNEDRNMGGFFFKQRCTFEKYLKYLKKSNITMDLIQENNSNITNQVLNIRNNWNNFDSFYVKHRKIKQILNKFINDVKNKKINNHKIFKNEWLQIAKMAPQMPSNLKQKEIILTALKLLNDYKEIHPVPQTCHYKPVQLIDYFTWENNLKICTNNLINNFFSTKDFNLAISNRISHASFWVTALATKISKPLNDLIEKTNQVNFEIWIEPERRGFIPKTKFKNFPTLIIRSISSNGSRLGEVLRSIEYENPNNRIIILFPILTERSIEKLESEFGSNNINFLNCDNVHENDFNKKNGVFITYGKLINDDNFIAPEYNLPDKWTVGAYTEWLKPFYVKKINSWQYWGMKEKVNLEL